MDILKEEEQGQNIWPKLRRNKGNTTRAWDVVSCNRERHNENCNKLIQGLISKTKKKL